MSVYVSAFGLFVGTGCISLHICLRGYVPDCVGEFPRGFLVPFPGSSDSKRHTLQWEIISQQGKKRENAEERLIGREKPSGERRTMEGLFGGPWSRQGVWEGVLGLHKRHPWPSRVKGRTMGKETPCRCPMGWLSTCISFL